MKSQAELVNGVWAVREVDDDGSTRAYAITCEIAAVTDEVEQGAKVVRTCGKPGHYRAITGAGDASGRNYDERYSCSDCKATDEESGKYFVDGKLVEDYGPAYQYEEITLEWLTDV